MAKNFYVRVTGLDWWEKRVYYLSTGGLEREGAMPALKELDKQFRKTLTELFAPGGGKGVEYKHGYTGSYLMGLHSIVTPDTLKIVEGNPTGGKEIREGGRPGSWTGIFGWAKQKLNVPTGIAAKIARVVTNRGYIGGGQSPIRSEYPSGERKFQFPEWIVTIKNKDDIDRAARTVDTLIVKYLR